MKCAHYVVTPEHPIKDKQKFSGYINISLMFAYNCSVFSAILISMNGMHIGS